jgi:hypothetical protein
MSFLHEEYLKALRSVEARATSGPWRVTLEGGYPVAVQTDRVDSVRIVAARIPDRLIPGGWIGSATGNAAFIAASRDAVPRLLAENRYLRTLLNLSAIGEESV